MSVCSEAIELAEYARALTERPVELSIVIPVYNEVENVSRLHEAIKRALAPTSLSYEIIYVDDGSNDGTAAALQSLAGKDGRARVIQLKRNFGQTIALGAGFDHAQGEYIVSMDGDLQNDPADIPGLLDKLKEGYDLVTGWRHDRHDALLRRKVPSRIANLLLARVTGAAIHDTGCSLKAYRAELVRRLPLYAEFHRFIPAMSLLAGARYAEIKVRHHPRRFGKSKYGLSRVWRVLLDVLVIKMLTAFSSRPLHWFGVWSAPFFVLAAALGGQWLAMILQSRTSASFVLPTVTMLMAVAAIHLLGAGVIADLLIHQEPAARVKPITQRTRIP
jgi:glycosyltransferase involved in cell wall biosynthesis